MTFNRTYYIYQIQMEPSPNQDEERHALQSDPPLQNSRETHIGFDESFKLLWFLIHIRQNRILYFIVAASLLLLVAMMQIHSAYRSYEDNEKLVKLWLEDKEVKEIISNNQRQKDQQRPQFIIEPRENNQTLSNYGGNSRQKAEWLGKQDKKQDAQIQQNDPKQQTAKEHTQARIPVSKLFPTYFTRKSDRLRPIAGITIAQVKAVSRWRGLINQDIQNTTDLSQEEEKYYEQKYSVGKYYQLPFCVVVPSYNNVKSQRHINNIKSILMQNYSNYHIVFIDDASTDRTGDQVQAFLQNQTKVPPSKYVVLKNEKQQKAMPNLRRAAKEYCKPYEIFMIVDGDDELVGRMVLKLFNSVFQKDKVWFVYSNFISIRGNVGYSRPFPANTMANNGYRRYPFVTSHLRAFYTQLFLNVKEEDLKDEQGKYLQAANDVAICIPILQQSHEKVRYIPELTYFYNSNTGQNNHQIRLREQKTNDRMLRRRKPYAPLDSFYTASS